MLILKALFLLLAVFIVMPVIFFVLLRFIGKYFFCTIHPTSPLARLVQQQNKR